MTARFAPVTLTLVVVTVLLMLPGDTTPSGFPHADKITHALMFAVLAYASRFARIPPAATVAWLAVYAALTEVLQAAVAVRRSGSVWDWCADLAGALLGIALYAAVRRRSRART
ncbi:membrane protein [Rhodococcus ruber Chol-4]|uniref:VanZ family protein n=1 Tax=Rhodococcus TaxID=1827 RepID=UPI00034D2249|nr:MULTISPECIES: VanZ family protein [Rhodococcus]NGR06352.1 VanZ family protein [bacterium SGD-2]AUM17507.1 VanZ family protein [Rhodococcus ruber]KXF86870.1 membrane protein [Rhodococcus ruber Chol-4]MCF8782017.1 VanZ family protein [Rhodococcus ruber]MDV3208281.1 VanZ family protein [Rhodococcus ruber]